MYPRLMGAHDVAVIGAGPAGSTAAYRLARVLTFLNPGAAPAEATWQVQQSLTGIGAGQLLGAGFGQGQQKLGYLPYAYSDFIFSTIGEEWGFVGVVAIALLFSLPKRADAGVIALVPVISPYRADRAQARAAHEAVGLPFFEVFVDTPIEICEARDPKGLYAKARAGEIKGFTGIDDPYEAPLKPELLLKSDKMSLQEEVVALLDLLESRGILRGE